MLANFDRQYVKRLDGPHVKKAKNKYDLALEIKDDIARFRNGALQGAYLILAARALGLDAGPMSGFKNAGVDQEFFPNGRWRSNLLINLGYGRMEAFGAVSRAAQAGGGNPPLNILIRDSLRELGSAHG